ncbi:MAG: enoyl-CoA hydratase/isomerase family protein [Candidatus Sericytochromatia bacterium]|nr:enoyl-CoA hydratase/isomerase family protein [Candidatus Sericytochromatia bacterium]
MAEQGVVLTVVDGVGQILFDRPASLNALDADVLQRFWDLSVQATTDPAVRVITMRGAGKAFTAGGDVAAMAKCPASQRQALFHRMVSMLHEGLSVLLRSGKPVIAGVRGVAAGAGFSLALASDLVVAARDARFTMAYTKMGLTPDGGGSFFLPRVVGQHRAMELMLTNRMLNADEALAWGVANRLCEPAALESTLQAWAAELAAGPAEALRRAKLVMANDLLHGLEEHLQVEKHGIVTSSVHGEFETRVAAFLAKQTAGAR